ncbi:MAG: ATP-dependent 6-phosphofructokinase [Planctomycetota bacterium]
MNCVGILTGGGDCPGLNAVIGAVVRKLSKNDISVLGILDGWKGLMEGEIQQLTVASTLEISPLGGTIIGTSRTNPYKSPEKSIPMINANLKKYAIEALIAIGGDDTIGVASRLYHDEKVNVVAIPKTIDNDISATDFTFGFDSAVNVAMEAIDKIRTTAESHHRVIVVEVMGRHAGWIATYAGLAGSADVILIPEVEIDIEKVCDILKQNRKRSKIHNYNIVVVAEGAVIKKGNYVTQTKAKDEFGNIMLGGIADYICEAIEKRTGFETRKVVLGYLQRGGAPTAFDRVLGIRYGLKAAELILEGKFGKMVALQGLDIVAVDIKEGVKSLKTVDMKLYEAAEEFFKP